MMGATGKLRGELEHIMYRLIGEGGEEQEAPYVLMERFRHTDPKLFHELDNAIGAALADAYERAFTVGFACGQDPTILLFEGRTP